MARFKTPRCRAGIKPECPFHGNAFHDSVEKRLKQYHNDVEDYGLPRNLSVVASNWGMRETMGFASAIVANAHTNLDYSVRAPMLNFIGDEKSDMDMLGHATSGYKAALQQAQTEFGVRKAKLMNQEGDEATKIAELSHYLDSQIFAAKAHADRIRAQMLDKQATIWPEDRRKQQGWNETQLLSQEALAYRLTEVRNKLDKQFKRSAKKSPPPFLPTADWFANASDEELRKAATPEARVPFDWMAPVPGEKAPEPFTW